MHELAKTIEKKIANEQKILTRESKEVTVDWVAVQAEIRLRAFAEVHESVCNRILKEYGYSPRPA